MTQPPTPPYGAPEPPPEGSQPPPYGAPQQPPAGYGQPQGYGQPPLGGGSFYINYMGQEHGPYELGHLAQMAAAGQLKPDAAVRAGDGQQYYPAKQIPGLFSDKEWVTTLILTWLLGSLGVDRFYLGYTGLGIAKLITFGGCGIWSLIDAILITLRKVPDAQGRPLS